MINNKIIKIVLLFSYFFSTNLQAQSISELAKGISPEKLKQHLTVLASDSLEGRETATIGAEKAAKYIIHQLKESGVPSGTLDNSYLQTIDFTVQKWDSIVLDINNKSFKLLKDFYAYPSFFSKPLNLSTDSILFAGYGIEFGAYSDYQNMDVSGKTVLIFDGEPVLDDSIPILRSRSVATLESKLKTAKEKNVALLLVVDRRFSSNLFEARKYLLSNALELPMKTATQFSVPTLFINPSILKQIIGNSNEVIINHREIANSGLPKPPIVLNYNKFHLTAQPNITITKGSNIIAKIEGSDPVLKNEYVFLSAHYDHLGKRGEDIFHGADDDGSGTTALLQIMKTLGDGKKNGIVPKRTIVALWVTGEEKGLLGSRYYVENPIYPLQKTVTDLNIDMIGRIDPAHESNPNYVYIIGSDMLSKDLHSINVKMNKQFTNLLLDYKYNSTDDPNRFYYRSDHYNFAKNNIPIIFYFNGTHADYHKTTDTVDKINFDVMSNRAKLVFHNAWYIANRAKKVVLD